MTALVYGGEMPTPGGDEDTWGDELVVIGGDIHTDLEMLNTSPTARILGRVTASTGEVERLTGTQATTLLDAVVGDSGSGGTKGLVPAPATGDAAAGKVLGAGGSWTYPQAAYNVFTGSTGATLGNGHGVTCVRNAAGDYTLTLSPAMANANYAVFLTLKASAWLEWRVVGTKNTTTFSVVVQTTSAVAADPDELYVQVLA